MAYGQVFEAPSSGRIKIVCPEDCYIGIRSGTSETSFSNNQYWYRSGNEIQFNATATKNYFVMCIAKSSKATLESPWCNTSATVTGITNITKDKASEVHLYFKDEFTGEFDASPYKLIEEFDTTGTNWRRATVTATGIGEDGSQTEKLAYNKAFNISDLRDNSVIMITCGDDYAWAIRYGNSETDLAKSIYWYNSGSILRLESPVAEGKFMITFKKVKDNRTTAEAMTPVTTITKDDAAKIKAKLYTAKDS